MPNYIRVRDTSTGHEYDVVEGSQNATDHVVLDGYPPSRGWPRPAKYRTDKGGNVITDRSTRAEIYAHASQQGIDVTGAATKAEALALIEAASQTPPTGEDHQAGETADTTTE